MSLNVDKSKILCLKGKTLTNSDSDVLETVEAQKDLGVIISRNLSWSDNCSMRMSKAWRAFFFSEKELFNNIKHLHEVKWIHRLCSTSNILCVANMAPLENRTKTTRKSSTKGNLLDVRENNGLQTTINNA